MEGNVSLRRLKVKGYKILFFFTAVLTTLKNAAFTFLYSVAQESPISSVLVLISFGSTHATNNTIRKRLQNVVEISQPRVSHIGTNQYSFRSRNIFWLNAMSATSFCAKSVPLTNFYVLYGCKPNRPTIMVKNFHLSQMFRLYTFKAYPGLPKIFDFNSIRSHSSEISGAKRPLHLTSSNVYRYRRLIQRARAFGRSNDGKETREGELARSIKIDHGTFFVLL